MKIKLLLTLFFSTQLFSSSSDDAEFFKLLDELFNTPSIAQETPTTPKLKIENNQKNILIDKVEAKSIQTLENLTNHINKYYPRVFVIREKFFSYMAPQDISRAFEQIVEIIANRPWFYLEQLYKPIIKRLEPNDLKTWQELNHNIDFLVEKFKNKNLKNLIYENGFENFIADQLVYFHNFLKKAKVDIQNNLVFYDESQRSFNSSYQINANQLQKQKNPNEIALKAYLLENSPQVYFNFYELCADYWSRLFVNSISNNQINDAYRYFDDLRDVLANLKNSICESKVNEYIQKYRELLKTLRQKKAINSTDKNKQFEELMDYWDS
ncbi:MAG: hypothetical protein ABIF12_02600 [bacterium]